MFRRALAPPLFFAVAAIALTWPLAVSPGEAVSVRGDYYLNTWNFWWMGQALSDESLTALRTDYLHHPLGVSLARHVRSPINSIPGAWLSGALGLHGAYTLLLLVHFWLSGWFAWLFAREVTGSRHGALLAGLLYAFSPFHFYYLGQLNVATQEFLPLAAYFLVRSYRAGGLANLLGVALSAALLAASSSYFAVYAAIFGALLLAGGRLWSPDTPFASGARRLAIAALAAALAMAAVAGPLLTEGMTPAAESAEARMLTTAEHGRWNDLSGFLWLGAPEKITVSWPTMLGYTALLLVALGARRDRRLGFWLGLAAFFLVLSLGPQLHVGGRATGVPLPYAWFSDLPVLWMLRKADRIFVMVLLCFGVVLATAWQRLESRLPGSIDRRGLTLACAGLLVFEFAALPLETFAEPASPYLDELAQRDDVRAVVHLPHGGVGPTDSRSNYYQTRHGKRIPQGYVVTLTLEPEHFRAAADWQRAGQRLREGDASEVLALAARREVDLLLLEKAALAPRSPIALDGRTLWWPFVLVRQPLVSIRQQGHMRLAELGQIDLWIQKNALEEALGPPDFEDDFIVVYDRRRGSTAGP